MRSRPDLSSTSSRLASSVSPPTTTLLAARSTCSSSLSGMPPGTPQRLECVPRLHKVAGRPADDLVEVEAGRRQPGMHHDARAEIDPGRTGDEIARIEARHRRGFDIAQGHTVEVGLDVSLDLKRAQPGLGIALAADRPASARS
jgi:hypothetical protein